MEGLEGDFGSFIADFESPVDSEVTQRLFDDVSECTQARCRGCHRCVLPVAIPSPMLDSHDHRLGASGVVAHDLLESHPAPGRRHLGKVLEHRQEHVSVGNVGGRHTSTASTTPLASVIT